MPKRLVNALNPKTVASLTKPGSYADGGGLELRVDAKGAPQVGRAAEGGRGK